MTINECYAVLEGSYDDMIARLASEDRIKRFLSMFPKDSTFNELCKAMEEENYELAFRSAHTLKGLCLNLGIERLRRSADAITEALRGNQNNGADALLPQVIQDYQIAMDAISQLD